MISVVIQSFHIEKTRSLERILRDISPGFYPALGDGDIGRVQFAAGEVMSQFHSGHTC